MTSPKTAVDVKSLYSEIWQNRQEYIMFRIAKQVADLTPELNAKGCPPLKLSIGAPTLPAPQAIKDVLIASLSEKDNDTYSTTRGELSFRKACASRMKQRFGVEVDAEKQVCALIGSKEGLGNVFRGLITPYLAEADKEVILVPDPGYASYVDAIEGAGGKAVSIRLNPENKYLPNLNDVWQEEIVGQGIDPKKVKAVVVNYPSNPIGAVAPLSYLQHTVDFAREHGILAISDNAYADMYFSPEARPHSILEAEGALDCAIEFHSLSKPYSLTGWRLGFAVGHQDAVDLVALVKSTMDSGIFKGLQKAGTFAITSPDIQAYIEEVAQVYAHSQAVTLKGLKRLGWPVEAMNPPKATFYLWVPIPKRYSSCEQFSQDLLKTSGIVVVPGTAFGPNGEGFIRLSLVLPEEQLNEVFDRMARDGFTYERA